MAAKAESKQTTRLKMVNAAIDLFHKNGINATSVDDVLKQSGTGKSQFTHYFNSKAGLVQAAIRHLSGIIRDGRTETGYEIRNWKEMNNWFRTYIDFQESVDFERSCPIGTIASDLASDLANDPARSDVVTFLDWGRNQLSLFFAKKLAAGELPKSVDTRRLADLCIATMQGGMLLTKIRRDPEMFSNASAEVLSYIKRLRDEARAAAKAI